MTYRDCGSNIQGNYSPHLCSIRVEGRWLQQIPPSLTPEERAEYRRYYEIAADTICAYYQDPEADECSCAASAEASQRLAEMRERWPEDAS